MNISKNILLFLLLLTFSACSSPSVGTPLANPTPVQAISTPTTVAPTETLPPPPTDIPPTETPDPALLHSDWIGGLTHADGSIEAILVRLDAGTLTLQPQSEPLTLEGLVRVGNTLSFQVRGAREMQMTGQWDGEQIVGVIEENGQTNALTLQPMTEAGNLADYAGTYQFENGAALTVQLSPSFRSGGLDFFWEGLTVTDFGTGAIRGLYPVATDKFLVGSARVLGYPFGAEIGFVRTGEQVTGLFWTEVSGERQAVRLDLPTETVTYTTLDGITLTGLLTLPTTSGPHPAIVVLHGSERGERNDFFREQLRTFFASQGIVTLTYDKRGVGDSGGTYRESASEENLTLLAQDVLAGVGYLQTRPEVDGSKIGLIGSSQAGWVIPLAAQSADVAYFIILSGPVVSVGIEDAYSAYANDGDSPTELTPEQLSQLLAERTPSGFDPVPILATLTQPGLWLWGTVDMSIPVPESVVNLEALIAAGQGNFSYEVYSGLDHNLQVSEAGLFREIPFSTGFGEEVFTKILNWINEVIQSP